jgi:hypothetical protein
LIASQARAIKDKEIDEDDDWLMFLVPVTGPTDDFDPYDAPGGLNNPCNLMSSLTTRALLQTGRVGCCEYSARAGPFANHGSDVPEVKADALSWSAPSRRV